MVSYTPQVLEGVHLISALRFHYQIPGDDFTRAGEASSHLKNKLKQIGVKPDIIRKIAIAMYEGEINLVIHAGGGEIEVIVNENKVIMVLEDQGPGIADIELAMQAGYSTAPDNVRALGFGAGMGLPNIKKYSDWMQIESVLGVGTKMIVEVNL